jgi:hypothetical protein
MNQVELDQLAGLLDSQLARSMAPPVLSLAVNGAIPIDRDLFVLLTKAGVAAMSIAAPGAANIGRVLQIYGATADQNVLTFTGGTLRSGAAGVTTVTGAAAIGSGITVKAVTATTWQLLNNTLAVVT